MKLFLKFAICLLILNPLYSQKFELNPQSKRSDSDFDNYLTDYDLYTLDLVKLSSVLKSEVGSEIELNSPVFNVNLDMAPNDILAPNLLLKGIYEDQIVTSSYNENHSYIAYDQSEPGRSYRFYISDNQLRGKFISNGKTYIIESAQRFDPGSAKNEIVVYHPKNFKSDEKNRACQVLDAENIVSDEESEDVEGDQKAMLCKEIQLSLAADYLLFDTYGSLEGVVAELVSIINASEGDYNIQMDDEVNFEIVEILISCCLECDPWTSSTSMFSLLTDFKEWGLFGGFERPHDLGLVYTDRVTDNGVVGVAYMNTLCGTNKYLAIAHYTSNAEALRMVTSHEMGHTFGCPHNYVTSSDCHPDPGRPALIMDPVVDGSAVAWATGTEGCVDEDPGESTVDRINAKLSNGSCFDTTCDVPDCEEVTDIMVENIWADYAELSWLGTANSFNVKVRKDMSSTYLLDMDTDEDSYILDATILEPATLYVVSIESLCGSNSSNLRDAEFYTPEASIAIPVELVSFTAHADKNVVEIDWETAAEINSSHFRVLHSTDGIDFQVIGELDSKGNPASLSNEYTFVHEQPAHGINYYSLEQFDLDGRSERFDNKVVDMDLIDDGNIMKLVYQDGNGVELAVDTAEEKADLYVFDTNGNLIMSKKIWQSNRVRIDSTDLPTGVYFVQVNSIKRMESLKLFMY